MDDTGVLAPETASFSDRADVIVVGGGACGFCAALAARDQGANVLLLERDSVPLGTTAMSVGFIPAAGTRFQKDAGVEDRADLLADDILAKNKGETDADMVRHIARESAPTIEWLVDSHQIPLAFMIEDHYPGHSVPRMHGTPNRTGTDFMQALLKAAQQAGVRVETNTTATHLFADGEGRIHGVRVAVKGDTTADIQCGALVLASCGFAANHDLISEYIPEIAAAVPYAHAGAQGDAVRWGQALGAAMEDLHAYQSFGGLSVESKTPVPWAHILRGGIQVNAEGRRFSDESRNYAERALDVLCQPGGFAWSIFDERIAGILQQYKPYRVVEEAGCVLTAEDAEELMNLTGLPAALTQTLTDNAAFASGEASDPIGRDFTKEPPLTPPYKAVKVTGALYHTQGGLKVDKNGRVMKSGNESFLNLFAGGGAARGISGPGSWGYLAGNGLLTATVFGRLAGLAAASVIN